MMYEKGTFTTVVTQNMIGLSPYAQVVYFWLCSYANSETRECYPSKSKLAELAGCSEERVRMALIELIEAGLVESNERHRSDGSQTSNMYIVMVCKKDTSVVPPTQQVVPPPTHHVGAYELKEENEPNTPLTPQGGMFVPSQKVSGQVECPPEAQQGVLARFDEFWRVYPRKAAKPMALRVFKRLTASDITKAIANVHKMKETEQWKKSGGMYIPMPATYLNQRRWEDEITLTPAATKDFKLL